MFPKLFHTKDDWVLQKSMFQEMYQLPQTNIEQRHMKEAKNGDSEAEGGGKSEGGTKLEENSSQPKNKQEGILIFLQVRNRNL